MKKLYQIPNFPNYSISKDGEIWSEITKKYLKSSLDRDGYARVHLWNNGKQLTVRVHQLLANTFIPNPNNKPTVDHINRNKIDNRIENLRWATISEQLNNRNCGFDTNAHPVECRSKDDPSIILSVFSSSSDAAEKMFSDKSKNSLINRCANGKKSSAYGYVWTFCE